MNIKILITFLVVLLSYNFLLALPKCNGDFSRHCFASINHKNGERYVGEVKNYKYEGKGTYLYVNGNIYEGEFKKW